MPSVLRRSAVAVLAVGLLALSPARADVNPHEKLKQHVRDVVQAVKAAPTAAEKRAILDEKLRGMIAALDRAERMATLSAQDQKGIDALRARLQEKLDELHGQNGYEAVPAGQLDAFADYVQQDFEQADRTLTISLTTALLVVILLLLLA
jgi:ribosome assembly protein YihI (activator of Der GTPase)